MYGISLSLFLLMCLFGGPDLRVSVGVLQGYSKEGIRAKFGGVFGSRNKAFRVLEGFIYLVAE